MFVTFPYETGFWLLFCLVYRLSLDFCKLCSLNFYWVLGFFSFFLPPFACLLCLVICGYQFYYVLKNYFALMVKCLFFICYLIHLIFSFLCCWIHSFKSVFINNLSTTKVSKSLYFQTPLFDSYMQCQFGNWLSYIVYSQNFEDIIYFITLFHVSREILIAFLSTWLLKYTRQGL